MSEPTKIEASTAAETQVVTEGETTSLVVAAKATAESGMAGLPGDLATSWSARDAPSAGFDR
jgi:hypothetical protein